MLKLFGVSSVNMTVISMVYMLQLYVCLASWSELVTLTQKHGFVLLPDVSSLLYLFPVFIYLLFDAVCSVFAKTLISMVDMIKN